MKKTENGTTTYYLRSSVLGGQVVAELNGGGVLQRNYVYLGGQLLTLKQSSNYYWVHEDPITKSKRVTDASGAVVSKIELDPWGATVSAPFSSNDAFQPKKFTSYERDGNGSDEAMFRRFNRWHSRFDQPDPYDGSYSLTNPQSFNRYAYVQGDPVNFVDPSGLIGAPGGCWIQDWTNGAHPCPDPESLGLPGSGPSNNSGARPPHDGPGGDGGAGVGTAGKEIGANEYNNCYEFVDYLVSLAIGLNFKPPSAFQASSQNKNMVINLGLKMIQEALDYKYIQNISDGFKDTLVAGFQNSGVYGHVLLQAGAYLVGGVTGRMYAYGFAGYDKFQAGLVGTGAYPHQQDDQRPAEIAGNVAGTNVGGYIWSFLTGHKDSKKLKQDLTQELCKPEGGT